MKRRKWLLLAAAFILLMLTLSAWAYPRYALWGWVRGESFYGGYPTSYWRRVCASMRPVRPTPFNQWMSWFEQWLGIAGSPMPELTLLGEGDPQAIPVMLEVANDEDPWTRRVALHFLGMAAPKCPHDEQGEARCLAVVQAIVASYERGNMQQRRSALLLLPQIGRRAALAVPVLEADLEEPDLVEREKVAGTILFIDPHHERAFAALRELFVSPDVNLQIGGLFEIEPLSRMHPDEMVPLLRSEKTTLTPVLLDLTRNARSDVQDMANRVLKKIDPEGVKQPADAGRSP